MSDYTWDQVDVDETITETEQKQSNSLDINTPVGQMLCEVVECNPIEKDFEKYSCMAAKLKMKIDGLITIEQPIFDSSGKPVKREGEIMMKVQPIPAEKKAEFEALFLGQFVFDEINLFHPKEKEAMKKRRLFVAKRLGLITASAQTIGGREWAMAPGRKVLVTTQWNSWEDKKTKEIKKNVKVTWSGYDFYNPGDAQADTNTAATNAATNDFSGI